MTGVLAGAGAETDATGADEEADAGAGADAEADAGADAVLEVEGTGAESAGLLAGNAAELAVVFSELEVFELQAAGRMAREIAPSKAAVCFVSNRSSTLRGDIKKG